MPFLRFAFPRDASSRRNAGLLCCEDCRVGSSEAGQRALLKLQAFQGERILRWSDWIVFNYNEGRLHGLLLRKVLISRAGYIRGTHFCLFLYICVT